MRLKKLEITGFKSFMDKTKIVFPVGISAVVGPNGCGKSNIVDALRWVMGEQSVKQLRGKSREDIIFAGASGKKPVNLAEVSLLIENTLGSAPENLNEYVEIMITRRLYRSGESVYLINGQPCRLKDIHDLFLGSGTGKNSFAVIQQGNIGAITDATAEERRTFIEEAADITKYKTKKKETLLKIAATKENLIRIADISSEIKRQIEALNRQVKKATRFKEYRKRIKALDIKIALWNFECLTDKIKEIKTSLDKLKDSKETNIQTLEGVERVLADAGIEFLSKKHKIEDLKTRQFETQRNIDKKENDTEHLKLNKQNLDNEIRADLEKHDELKIRNSEVAGEIKQLESTNVDIGDEIQNEENRLEKEIKKYDELKNNLAVFEEKLKSINSKHLQLAIDNAKYKNSLINAKKREEDNLRRLKIIDEEILTSEKKLLELTRKKHEAEKRIKEINGFFEDLKETLKKLANDLADKKEDLAIHLEFLRLLEIENSRASSRYQTLAKMHESYDWYKDGVKAVMEICLKDDKGVLGIFADIIGPCKGYEKAVEAALGEALQYIIVDTFESGVDLVNFLNENKKGQSGFIPCDLFCESFKKFQDENILFLIDYIDYPAKYENLVKSLIADCVVCETFFDAIELKKESKIPFTIVSKSGELISDKGVISGGNNTESVSILEKKQELQSLKELVDNNTEELNLAEEISIKKKQEIDLGLVQEKQFLEELDDLDKEKNEFEKIFYLADADVIQAKRRLEIALLEQEQMSGEQYDLEVEIQDSKGKLEIINKDIDQFENEIKKLTTQIREGFEILEKYNREIIDIRLNITSLKARNENYHSSLSRLRAFLKEGQERDSRLEDDIKKKIENNENTCAFIKQNTKELNDSYQAFKIIIKELESANEAYEAIGRIVAINETKIKEFNNENELISGKIHAAQILLAEYQMKRESITGRIEAKYHNKINQYQLEFNEYEHDGKPVSEFDIVAFEAELDDLNHKIKSLGDVNLGAILEFEELNSRYDFMLKQQEDLISSLKDLETIIDKINGVSQERFIKIFHAINEKLSGVFARLFEGGTAELVLTEPSKPLETGVELMIKPPGKTLTRLSLLSGGEKALSAIAFVFSVFLIKPASFCIMDEIDAPLDDSNVVRFNNLVKMIGEQSQILIITHNKLTMEFADVLFGVTMEKKGVSKLVSVKLTKDKPIFSGDSELAFLPPAAR